MAASGSPDLSGQVAVVTGGGRGRGLGCAFATAVARAGAAVAILARSADQLEEAAAAIDAIGGRVLADRLSGRFLTGSTTSRGCSPRVRRS